MSHRRALMLSEKMQIIDLVEKEGKSARDCSEKFKCGRSQIYDILKRKDKLTEDYDHGKKYLKKMRRRTNNLDGVNEETFEWFVHCRTKRIPISGLMVQAKAKEIAAKMDLQNFKASNGWLRSFRRRYGVFCKTKVENSDSVDTAFTDEWDHFDGAINRYGGHQLKTLCWSGFSKGDSTNDENKADRENSNQDQADAISLNNDAIREDFVDPSPTTQSSRNVPTDRKAETGIEGNGPDRYHEKNCGFNIHDIVDQKYQHSPKKIDKGSGGGLLSKNQPSNTSWRSKNIFKAKEQQRNDLLLSDKLNIIELIENKGKSVRECVELFKCGKTQIYNILKRKEELMEDFEFGKQHLKRMGCGPNDINLAVDEETFEWFLSYRLKQMPISGPMIQAKAKKVALDKGLQNFKASNGWLCSFRRRHGIIWKTFVREDRRMNTASNAQHGDINEANTCDLAMGSPSLNTLCWSGFYKSFNPHEQGRADRPRLEREYPKLVHEGKRSLDDDVEEFDESQDGSIDDDAETNKINKHSVETDVIPSHKNICSTADAEIIDEAKYQPSEIKYGERGNFSKGAPAMSSHCSRICREDVKTEKETKQTPSSLQQEDGKRRINSLADGLLMLRDLQRLIESKGIIEFREEMYKFRKSFERQMVKCDKDNDRKQRKISDYFNRITKTKEQ